MVNHGSWLSGKFGCVVVFNGTFFRLPGHVKKKIFFSSIPHGLEQMALISKMDLNSVDISRLQILNISFSKILLRVKDPSIRLQNKCSQ